MPSDSYKLLRYRLVVTISLKYRVFGGEAVVYNFNKINGVTGSSGDQTQNLPHSSRVRHSATTEPVLLEKRNIIHCQVGFNCKT